MYRVIYTHRVRNQISDQVAYFKRQNVSIEVIEDWTTRLMEKIESLYDWPLRYPVAEVESTARGVEVRKMSFGNYLVTYRVDETAKTVEVLSFRHGARRSEFE